MSTDDENLEFHPTVPPAPFQPSPAPHPEVNPAPGPTPATTWRDWLPIAAVVLAAVLLGGWVHIVMVIALFWGGYSVGVWFFHLPIAGSAFGCGLLAIYALIVVAGRRQSSIGLSVPVRLVRLARSLVRRWDSSLRGRTLTLGATSVLGLLRSSVELMNSNVAEAAGAKEYFIKIIKLMPPAVGVFLVALPLVSEWLASWLRTRYADDAQRLADRADVLAGIYTTFGKAKLATIDGTKHPLNWAPGGLLKIVLSSAEAAARAYSATPAEKIRVTLWKVQDDKIVERVLTVPFGEPHWTSLDTINNEKTGAMIAVKTKRIHVAQDVRKAVAQGGYVREPNSSSEPKGSVLSIPVLRGVEALVVGVLCFHAETPNTFSEYEVPEYERRLEIYCQEIVYAGLIDTEQRPTRTQGSKVGNQNKPGARRRNR